MTSLLPFSAPRSFTPHIDDATLARVLDSARAFDAWPPEPQDANPWRYGTSLPFMRDLIDRLTNNFDWRAWEARLNEFTHFHADVDGLAIHYIREEASAKDAPTLLLTHGWPGSIIEFVDIIPRLAHPERFGGKAEDGLTVVAPSLPGFGFSQIPPAPMGPKRIAELWNTLARGPLGLTTYYAQGGDWGSVVTGRLALDWPASREGGGCVAAHFNMGGLAPPPPTDGKVSKEEAAWANRAKRFFDDHGGYFHIQATRPQSLAMLAAGSVVGPLAWIGEKFLQWSDAKPAPDVDTTLANIMLYLLTDTFASSCWIYFAAREEACARMKPGEKVDIPVAFAESPREIYPFPPEATAARGYSKVLRKVRFDKGGHFAAMERPEEMANDILAFFNDPNVRPLAQG